MKLLDLIYANQSLSFFDLESEKECTINELIVEIPLKTEGRFLVFIYTDNSIASLAALFSCWNIENATIALFSETLAEELKEALEQQYQPMCVVDKTREVIPDYHLIESISLFPLFISNEPRKFEIDNQIKLLLSTSGTTGSPKLVKLSERNVVENALSIIDYLPIESSDQTPLCLPIHYSYGFSVLTTNSIKGGRIYTAVDDMLKRTFWQTFKSYKFTSIVGVPFVYEMLNRLGFYAYDLPSLKYFTQAGGRLNADLIEKFYQYSKEKNCRFFVMYGQTEATARMSYLPPQDLESKKGSIGKPLKNGKFIIDEHSGELLYGGPNVFGGYAQNRDDLAIYEQPLWLRTGDLAQVDNDGYYFIIGRLKRFAKIAGNRVNLDELENYLKLDFNSAQLACLNIDDKKIAVFIKKDAEIDPERLIEFLRDKFTIHHTMVQVVFIEELPLTANGKVDLQYLYNSFTEDSKVG
ncbi:Long-chain-fatty-acid--CoA ligase [compost metagenome]